MPMARIRRGPFLKTIFFFFQDVGFSKEYEELRADSCLEEYTAQDSQNPENQSRNRYPNIVACEYIVNTYPNAP